MNTDKIKADFQFLNSQVTKFSINNNMINLKGKTVHIDCDMDYDIGDCREVENGFWGTLYFIVKLSAKIKDKDDEVFDIYLKIKGNFAGSKNTSIDHFKNMLEINGTATLSQISRAYITSVTSLSGIIPINLPMINIYSLKKRKEKENNVT